MKRQRRAAASSFGDEAAGAEPQNEEAEPEKRERQATAASVRFRVTR